MADGDSVSSRARALRRFGAVAVAVALLGVLVLFVFRVVATDPPVATLGPELIRESDFSRYLASIHPPERVTELLRDPSARDDALEEYLDVRALEAKSRRDGLEGDPRFVKAVQLMESRTLAHLEMERYRAKLETASVITSKDVEAYYAEHAGAFLREPRFTAHHLLVYVRGNPAFPERGLPKGEALATAKRALLELRRGRSWDEVARRYSDDLAAKERGGLLLDRQFGYFAEPVELALRTHPLDRPSDVLETEFGYYVVQVVERTVEPVAKPLDEVRGDIEERLRSERIDAARKTIFEPLRREVGFEVTEAGLREGPLFDERANSPEEILGKIEGRPIRQSDFGWFCRDALLPHQRASADARPGARRGLLEAYFDQLVLEAKAKREGRDRTIEFSRLRAAQLAQLRAEFLREREQGGSGRQASGPVDERERAERAYLDRVRSQVGLKRQVGQATSLSRGDVRGLR
ncbi:MAG: peptidylprolyl isomerase [Polyangiaceae bacterium]